MVSMAEAMLSGAELMAESGHQYRGEVDGRFA